MNKLIGRSLFCGLIATISACGGSSGGDTTTFTVRIANVGAGAIPTSTGEAVNAVFAPGAFAVHSPDAAPFFTNGASASPGLEIMAEDGGGQLLADEALEVAGVEIAGAFAIPEGATSGGPLTPGNSYVFEFDASPGDHLSLATMFVQSNDLFVAPRASGIALFDENGAPRSGDITSENPLWDAGTEVNQEPGVGVDQAPRQAGANTGAEENGVVRLLNESDFPLPPLSDTVQITLTPLL